MVVNAHVCLLTPICTLAPTHPLELLHAHPLTLLKGWLGGQRVAGVIW